MERDAWHAHLTLVPEKKLRKIIDAKVDVFSEPEAERLGAIAVAFAQLTPRQQQCIELFLRRKWKFGMIGSELGIDRSSVRMHIKRGTDALLTRWSGAMKRKSSSKCPSYPLRTIYIGVSFFRKKYFTLFAYPQNHKIQILSGVNVSEKKCKFLKNNFVTTNFFNFGDQQIVKFC